MEEMKVESVNPEVLYQTDKAAFDSGVATAKHYPRNIRNSVENAIAIVTLSEKFAQTCSYSLMRDGKSITGPSIHLAKVLVQNWKNSRSGSRVVAVNEKDIVCEGFCWDLENNVAIQVSVKRSILNAQGQRYSQDMIVMTGNAGNAIALRNAILAVIPRSVVDIVYDAALAKITGDLTSEEKLIAKRVQVMKDLVETYGLTESEILAAVGKQSKDHIGPDEIAILIGMNQAIKDGDSTIKESFRSSKRKKGKAEQHQIARNIELKLYSDYVNKITTVKEVEEARIKVVNDLEKVMICDEAIKVILSKPKPKAKAKRKPAPKAKAIKIEK